MNQIVHINIGRQSETGKWHAVMTLPDGKVRSTPGYDTHEECKRIVTDWLVENNIEFKWEKPN